MNIQKKLRTLLLEIKGGSYSYGCVMLSLDIPQKTWKEIQNKIDDKDVYIDPKDDTVGREDECHVTILYGLHNDIKDEHVEEIIDNWYPITITLSKVSKFEKDDYDVLKFDIENRNLKKFNREIKELPYTNDYPKYSAHCTIAYLKKGTADKYIKEFNEDLEPIELTAEKIKYSKADKTKKYYTLTNR